MTGKRYSTAVPIYISYEILTGFVRKLFVQFDTDYTIVVYTDIVKTATAALTVIDFFILFSLRAGCGIYRCGSLFFFVAEKAKKITAEALINASAVVRYRFLNRLKNSFVFSFFGLPKSSALLPSSSITPSAMKITWLEISLAKAIS